MRKHQTLMHVGKEIRGSPLEVLESEDLEQLWAPNCHSPDPSGEKVHSQQQWYKGELQPRKESQLQRQIHLQKILRDLLAGSHQGPGEWRRQFPRSEFLALDSGSLL